MEFVLSDDDFMDSTLFIKKESSVPNSQHLINPQTKIQSPPNSLRIDKSPKRIKSESPQQCIVDKTRSFSQKEKTPYQKKTTQNLKSQKDKNKYVETSHNSNKKIKKEATQYNENKKLPFQVKKYPFENSRDLKPHKLPSENMVQISRSDSLKPLSDTPISFIPCPVCDELFDENKISSHASTCFKVESNDIPIDSEIQTLLDSEFILCPICLKDISLLSVTSRENHVNVCINVPTEQSFSTPPDEAQYSALSTLNFCPICNSPWSSVVDNFFSIKFGNKLSHSLKCSIFFKVDLKQILKNLAELDDSSKSIFFESNSIFCPNSSGAFEHTLAKSYDGESYQKNSVIIEEDDFQPVMVVPTIPLRPIPYTKQEKLIENKEIELVKKISKVSAQENINKKFKVKTDPNSSEVSPPLEAQEKYLILGLSSLRCANSSYSQINDCSQNIQMIEVSFDHKTADLSLNCQSLDMNFERSYWKQSSSSSPISHSEIVSKTSSLKNYLFKPNK